MYIRNNLGSYGGLEGYWAPSTFNGFGVFGGMPALCNRQGSPVSADAPGGKFLCSDMPMVISILGKVRAARRDARSRGVDEDEIQAIINPIRAPLGSLRRRARGAIRQAQAAAAAATVAPAATTPSAPAPRPSRPPVASPVAPPPPPRISTVPAPAATTPAVNAASYSQIPITPGAVPVQAAPAVQAPLPGMPAPMPMMVGAPMVGVPIAVRQGPARGPARAPSARIAMPIIGGKKLPVAAGLAALAALMFM